MGMENSATAVVLGLLMFGVGGCANDPLVFVRSIQSTESTEVVRVYYRGRGHLAVRTTGGTFRHHDEQVMASCEAVDSDDVSEVELFVQRSASTVEFSAALYAPSDSEEPCGRGYPIADATLLLTPSSTPDAGADAPTTDGGTSDASENDTGVADTGTMDGETTNDAAVSDATTEDVGAVDAGDDTGTPTDAGDDAGSTP